MSSQSEHHDVLSLLFHLLSGFDLESLVYAVLDGCENLPVVDSDVDVWIKREDLARCSQVIARVAELYGWRVSAVSEASRIVNSGEMKYILVSPSLPAETLQLDIWSELHWRGLSYVDSSCLELSRAQTAQGYYQLSAGLRVGTLIIKDLLYNSRIKDKRRRMHDWDDAFLHASFEKIFGAQVKDQLIDSLNQMAWASLESMTPKLKVALIVTVLKRQPLQQISNWGHYLLSALKLRLRRIVGP
jgi:hypothetical protein